MIDEFSAFARMPAPVFKLEDMVGLVRQAVEMQEVAHPEISFVAHCPADAVMLRCDGRQVVRVLTNLLQNAADSITERDPPADGALPPGKVRVSLTSGEAGVVVEVSDNGRGLPADIRGRLVEPYVTTRSKGTGLGLAIVKKIVEDHGGELVFEDEPDGGARVRVIFSAAAHGAAEAPPAAAPKRVVSHGV